MNEEEHKSFWLWLLNEADCTDNSKCKAVKGITRDILKHGSIKRLLISKREEWINEQQYGKEKNH